MSQSQEIVTTGGQALEKKKPEPPKTIEELTRAMRPMIVKCLPQHINPERMMRTALTAIRTTKDLDKCTLSSFGAALLGASLMGLEPNTPLKQCYLLPFYSGRHKCMECTLIVGYQGIIDLARRSGQVAHIQSYEVMESDEFAYYLDEDFVPKVTYRPDLKIDRDDYSKLVGVFTVCKFKDKDADPIVKFLNKQGIERRRKRGASGKTDRWGKPIHTPWDDDPVAMALKSGVRAIDPWLPKSSELALAMSLDGRSDRGASQLGAILPSLPVGAAEELEAHGVDITQLDDGDESEESAEGTPEAANGNPAVNDLVAEHKAKAAK